MSTEKLIITFSILEDASGGLHVKGRDGQYLDLKELEFWLRELRSRAVPRQSINSHENDLLLKHLRVFSRATGPGYIYLVGVNDQVFKIGQTGHLKDRLASLRRQVLREKRLDLELIHVIETQDRIKAEALLHNTYQAKNIGKEWFSLSLDEVAEIQAIATIGGVA